MNDNIRKVLRGYVNLTEDEKKEVEKILGFPDRDTMIRQGYVDRATKEFTLGPVHGGCPCCGK